MTWTERIRRALPGARPTAEAAPAHNPAFDAVADEDRLVAEAALPYTMTGVARILALIDATRYCTRRAIPGAFAECGVWRGGSVLAMILTLQQEGVMDRDIYLFDTFEGMTEPSEFDRSPFDRPALETWTDANREGKRAWSEFFAAESFNEETVRETVLSTGYPPDLVHFVRGRVEDSLPGDAPGQLALLRLDTDWYESTRHELTHLYPRLSPRGVLIVDDYGHWTGSKRAVDEYFGARSPLLHRIDYSARLVIKD